MDGTGRVVYFDARRNFGFIEPDDDSGDVAFSVRPGESAPAVGENVAFELSRQPDVTPTGKAAARVWTVGFLAAAAAAEASSRPRTPQVPTEHPVTVPAAPASSGDDRPEISTTIPSDRPQ